MINLRSSLFALALSVSAAACQKAPDLNKVQSQALLAMKPYVVQLEVLQRRADANLTKLRTVGPGAPGASDAGRRLGDARGKLEQLRGLATGAPTTLATAAKSGRLHELQAAIDTTNNALVDGTLEITADLTAFENWAAFARPAVAMATPPAPPPSAPPVPAAEEKIGEHPPGARVEPVTGTPPVPPSRESDGGAKPAAAKPAAPPAAKPAARPAAPAATTPAKPAAKP